MSTKGHTHKANCYSSQRRAWGGGGVERRRIWVKGLRAPCEAPHATRSEVRKKNVSCFPPPTPLLFSNNSRGPFSSPPTLLGRLILSPLYRAQRPEGSATQAVCLQSPGPQSAIFQVPLSRPQFLHLQIEKLCFSDLSAVWIQ